MGYGGCRRNKCIDRKRQIRFALDLAVEDPGQTMEREQAEASPDPQPESGDSDGSS